MVKISDIGEFGLISRIRKTTGKVAKGVAVGIGDDAAVLRCSRGAELLATTDMLLEGVHFDLRTTDLYSLGWKAAAVNLSDIAAMGGVPRYCLVALGIPARTTVEDVGELYRGLNDCLERYGATLAGGDTCRSKRDLVVSVTVLGEVATGRAVTRSGAMPWDRIFVTGTLGDSGAGLELLQQGKGIRGKGSGVIKLIEKHLKPIPRIAEGRKLAGVASAMIDISDGLSSDLAHICEESGVGAEIFADRVPLSKELRSSKGLRRPLLEYAFSGGEDYELLFTVPDGRLRRFRALGIKATEIGTITGGCRVWSLDRDGGRVRMTAKGYDHFRRGRKRTADR